MDTEDIKIEEVEEMLAEDDELFDFEEEMDLKQKAFNLGAKVANVTSSKAFKIGKKIVKAGAVAAIAVYAYKKGIECGCNSLAAKELADLGDEMALIDDPELVELIEMEQEESVEEK